MVQNSMVTSFSPRSIAGLNRHCSSRQHTSTTIFSILDDRENDLKKEGEVNFSDFNPLSYKASKNKIGLDYETRISLRKTKMQELTGQLLDAVGDEAETQRILEEYKDFLLEPLEDLEAALVCISSSPLVMV